MRLDFQFAALPIENFSHLFSMNDAELQSHGPSETCSSMNPFRTCTYTTQVRAVSTVLSSARDGLLCTKVARQVISKTLVDNERNLVYWMIEILHVRESDRFGEVAALRSALLTTFSLFLHDHHVLTSTYQSH
jgi:hypothetical protein